MNLSRAGLSIGNQLCTLSLQPFSLHFLITSDLKLSISSECSAPAKVMMWM